LIEYDCETTGLQPWSGVDYPFLFQFYDGETAEAFEWSPDHPEHEAAIQAWLDRGAEEGIRAWNTKFDWAFADSTGRFRLPPEDKWFDGMIDAQAINERRSVALKAVGVELYGEDADDLQKEVKAWLNAENKRRRKLIKDADKALAKMRADDVVDFEVANLISESNKYRDADGSLITANYSDVPSDLMRKYGLEDVFLTRRVCDSQEGILANDSDLRRVIEFERRAMHALYAVEKRGLPANAEAYKRLEREVIENLERLDERVMELVHEADPVKYAQHLGKHIEVSEDGRVRSVEAGGSLEDFNPNSSPMIHAALVARGADLKFMSEKDGKLPMDADNLRAVYDDLAEAVLNYRHEAKTLSTYVRPYVEKHYDSYLKYNKHPFISKRTGRIHATYRQVGARTGRMSCADPNIQNQPRDDLRLRWNIEAEEGMALITCDLTNIEMVLFAAYCGEGRLLNAVRSGDDLHTLTAEMVGLRDRPRPGGGYESARQQGKVYNFTRIYGGGLRSIRRYFRVSMDEARRMKALYDRAYPEVGRLQARIDYKLQDDGYIQDKLISGRRFRVALRESYKATNYLIQGTAAALLKDAMIWLHAQGVPMVALVHDEILAHVPLDEAEEVAALIEHGMTRAAEPGGPLWLPDQNAPIVPLAAEAEIVKRWSDAKPVKDDEGREYLFDPEWANLPRRYLDEQDPHWYRAAA
jgi:DNA polymerase I-like protein with 3'-5' exonuclease and polymerase domains